MMYLSILKIQKQKSLRSALRRWNEGFLANCAAAALPQEN
jgi:hypothetical protein